MIALALALAVAAQPAGKVETWTFQAYCLSADLVGMADRVAYEEQTRQVLAEGGKPALDAFVAANPAPSTPPSLGTRRKMLMRLAIENGASTEVVDRQIALFQKNLSTLRLVDRPRFDRAVADCRIAT
jgi:hypothetical protein